jgi:uncharacterized protein YceH (UPF0502 family)
MTIRRALEALGRKGWTRFASGPGSRAAKYRHLLEEALHVSAAEVSLLAVLMLRGPQTVGELKSRSERMHRFDALADVEQTLAALAERELVERVRRPGWRDERWVQLLGEDVAEPGAVTAGPAPPPQDPLEARVARLEDDVAALRESLDALRAELGA